MDIKRTSPQYFSMQSSGTAALRSGAIRHPSEPIQEEVPLQVIDPPQAQAVAETPAQTPADVDAPVSAPAQPIQAGAELPAQVADAQDQAVQQAEADLSTLNLNQDTFASPQPQFEPAPIEPPAPKNQYIEQAYQSQQAAAQTVAQQPAQAKPSFFNKQISMKVALAGTTFAVILLAGSIFVQQSSISQLKVEREALSERATVANPINAGTN